MRMIIFHNARCRKMGDSVSALLDTACKRVPGVRSKTIVESPDDEREAAGRLLQNFDESIIVVPIHIPDGQERIMHWRRAVELERPLAGLGAICFVLQRHPSLDPRHWLDPVWTDILDDYAELAVPTSFVVWGEEEQQVKIFRLVAAVSGLAREIESLAELRRLDERVRLLEGEVEALGARLGSSNTKLPSKA